MQTPDEGYEYTLDGTTGEIVENEMALAPLKTETVMTDAAPVLVHPDQMPNLDEMDEGFTLAAKYIEFLNAGETQRGIFLGFSKMKNQKGELIDLANFQNQAGVWVNAGSNLVFQLRDRGILHGTPLQVKYMGKVKTKSNNEVKSFEIRLLNHKPTPQEQFTQGYEQAKRQAQPASIPNTAPKGQTLVEREQAAHDEKGARGEWTEQELDAEIKANKPPATDLVGEIGKGINVPSKSLESLRKLELKLMAQDFTGRETNIKQQIVFALKTTAIGDDADLRHDLRVDLFGEEYKPYQLAALLAWLPSTDAKKYISDFVTRAINVPVADGA